MDLADLATLSPHWALAEIDMTIIVHSYSDISSYFYYCDATCCQDLISMFTGIITGPTPGFL